MQNFNRLGIDISRYINPIANTNDSVASSLYSNGIRDEYNCISPAPSSTSSSKTRKKQKRTYYQSDNDSDVEVRKKPRNAILNESLKPESEEVDTIEDVLDTRLGREGNTGDETTVYNVLLDSNPVKTGSERQYLIKWKNWSHVHATWESEHSLTLRGHVEGMKKLDKYISKFREMERHKNSCNSDELERIIFAEEQFKDSHFQKMQIDRIIHHQHDKSSHLEYFIKWKTLDYKFVTAESSESVVEPLFKAAIQEYKDNLVNPNTPDTKNEFLRRRPGFKPLPENVAFGTECSPLYLRDYQFVGINLLLKFWTMGRNSILADEMGLGKTIQTIAFISVLFRRYRIYGPYLIIVPLSTINNWKKEFELWAPEVYTVVYTGDITSREVIRKYEWYHPGTKNYKFNVILTTYEIAMNDKNLLSSIYWVFLGVDEAHRLKSADSKLYKTIFPFRTNCRLLITGTPLQNNIKELWTLLHFIMPNVFETFDQFEHKFGTADNEQLCNDKLARLRETIEPFIIRREKKDVEKSLPAKSEQILRINMSQKQRELYRLILAKNFESLLAQTNRRTVFKNVIVELKKCCNHVELISDKLGSLYAAPQRLEYLIRSSGKMIVLDKLLSHLKTEGHRVLIFSQMVRMLDLLDVYLRLKGWGFQRLDGSISSALRNEAIKSFNATGSTDFCFLLSTRAGGLGINLCSADTVIIFDSDWNPHADLQAMARAHRIGQTKQVSIYRFVIKSSVEEKIIERAKRKMVLDHLVIQKLEANGSSGGGSAQPSGKSRLEADDFEAILRFSAQEIFSDKCDNEEADFNLQTILKQAEVQDHSSSTSAFLSSFKVISLDTDSFLAADKDEEQIDPHQPDSEPKEGPKLWSELIPQKYIDSVQRSQGDLNGMLDDSVLDTPTGARRDKRPQQQQQPPQQPPSQSGTGSGHDTVNLGRIETRRLISVMLRFGCPQQRADKILAEAQLQDKLKESDLVRLMLDIVDRCKRLDQQHSADGGGGGNSLTTEELNLEYNSYQIAVRPLLARLELLDELHAVMSVYEPEERRHRQFIAETKPTSWGQLWSPVDDNHLLVGVFEHGMSAWRTIKMDPALRLGDKILPTNPKSLPQAKHLNTRLNYLLDCLKRCCKEPIKLKIKLASGSRSDAGRNSSQQQRPQSGDHGASTPTPGPTPHRHTSPKKQHRRQQHQPAIPTKQLPTVPTKQHQQQHHEPAIPTKHQQHHEPTSLASHHNTATLSDSSSSSSASSDSDSAATFDELLHRPDISRCNLDDFDDDEFRHCVGVIFKECKAFMKEARKELEMVQKILTTEQKKSEFRYLDRNLLPVGKRISSVVCNMQQHQQITYFKYLWQFVKIFCPNYSAAALFQLYKEAVSKL